MYINWVKYTRKMAKSSFHKLLKNYKSSQILNKYLVQLTVSLQYHKIRLFMDGDRISLVKLLERVLNHSFQLLNH